MSDYIIRDNNLVYYENTLILTNQKIVEAINLANKALKTLQTSTAKFDVNIFEALGLRNLSGLVGEYFAKCVMRISEGKLQSNLHQDGYPDLLLVNTEKKKKYFESICFFENGRYKPRDKASFSPFKYGGLEVKACCGSTPTATEERSKPLIGEQRIQLVNGFDWKAHHRQTNHLLGLLWDFVETRPMIVACFYQNNLIEDDWGKIVKPKEKGGRTTSVSVMRASGIKKMCKNWIAILNDNLYTQKLSAKKWIGVNVKENP